MRDAGREGFDRRLIPPMVLGAILNPINSSMIAVALIPIGQSLGEPPSRTAWLVSALYLATAVGQPVAGRLVDALGPRRVFLAATVLVGVGGGLGMVAQSLVVLVVSRVLLGLGTCAGYPAAMFLIRSEARRTGVDNPTIVLTLLTFSSQTIAVIGPALGGLLIGIGGWRATLTVNLPLAVAAFTLGALRFPRGGSVPDGDMSLDLPGIGLFSGALLCLLVPVMDPGSGRALLVLPGLLLAALFVRRELAAVQPFIDVRVLSGNGPLVATYLRQWLNNIVSYSFIYAYTQWLEEGRGVSASQAGTLLMPMFITSLLVTAATGRRKAVRRKLSIGSAAQLVAALLLLRLDATSPIWLLVVVGVVVGIPQGLNSLANQTALYYQADPARIGASAGLLRTFMYLGAIVASAANATAFRTGATTAGLHELAWLLVGVAVGFVLLVRTDRSLRAMEDAPPA